MRSRPDGRARCRTATSFVAVCGFLMAMMSARAASPVREVRLVMGSTAEVVAELPADGPPSLDAAFAALTLVDDQMSLWKESDLTRLNAAGSGRVPGELFTVIAHALDVARASGGAFDPTVEPLVRASGGLGGPRRRLAAGERRALLARVGFEKVHLEPGGSAVTLDSGSHLDLGGIAKGHAADLALAALRAAGATRALVDLGESSIGVFGQALVVDVRDPLSTRGAPWAHFRLSEASVSTSGGDQKPGHIFDPRSGRPAARVLSATVVAASGIEADALSTAVYVLGVDEGLRLVESRRAAGFVLVREGGKHTIWTTPGFTSTYALVSAPDVRVREREGRPVRPVLATPATGTGPARAGGPGSPTEGPRNPRP